MGSFGSSMDFGAPSGYARVPSASNQHASQAGQYVFPQPAALGQSSTAFPAAGFDASAFAELDSNQVPLQRTRPAPAGGKDSSSMGDQAKQQAFNAGFPAAPTGAGAAPAGSWAAFLSGVEQHTYASPGAKAAGRRAGQQRGATPRGRPSRMQQHAQAAGRAGMAAPGAASPMFAFGSPMQASTSGAAAAGAPPAAGATPAAPGTAMSTDSTEPATFTAAFSAMSVDATPAFGSNSSGQPWAFRASRAAAFTGKRLFDTPSSAGADGGTPSPLGPWGQPARGSHAEQSPAAAGSRVGAEPLPFPGFGAAAQQDASSAGTSSSAAGGFSFNLGKATPGRSKARQRGSPANKSPPAASFAGFGSPASQHAHSSNQAGAASTPAAPAAATGVQASNSSGVSPGMASGASFQGFFAGQAPGSAASTPGYSPMMWSPVDSQAQAAAATAGPAPAAAATSGVSFEAVHDRQQSATAAERAAEARLHQVQSHLAQQQAAGAGASETAAAAAVDLPSDDSVESVAEVLEELSATGRQRAAGPEADGVAGLRAGVEQLSTADRNMQPEHQQPKQPEQQDQDPQQQQQPSGPSEQQHSTQQPTTAQEPGAVSGFVFGSPNPAAGTPGLSRTNGSASVTSPDLPGVTPSTLFEMSPLRSSSASGAGAAPAATAAPGSTAQPGVYGSSAAAAPTASAGAGGLSSSAGLAFTPGKAAGAAGAAGRPSARGRKQTPAKQARAPQAPAGTGAYQMPGSSSFAAAAFGAAGQPGNGPAQIPQQQTAPPFAAAAGFAADSQPSQQQREAAGDTAAPTSRRKMHAVHRRTTAASPQQQQAQGASEVQQQWPASAAQPLPPAGASSAATSDSAQFTLGSSKGMAGGAHARSPRKSRPVHQDYQRRGQQYQHPGMAQAGAGAAVQQSLAAAKASMKQAEGHWRQRAWPAAETALTQGIIVLVDHASTNDEAASMLCELYNHRASARIGASQPVGALQDALKSIECRKKFIQGYLRAATCLVKLGCLTAADRVLDKVLDMISASSSHYQDLNTKRRQVQQLLHKQQQVVAASLGCDMARAAAALAAVSEGQPVKTQLERFVSMAPAVPGIETALADAGTSPLEDAESAQQLLKDAEAITTELEFWCDSTALHAWLLLRSGRLDAAAAAAEAPPQAFFLQACRQQQAGQHPEWRWWLLAQVKWHQGDLPAVQKLLQQGQEQLQSNSSSSSGALWQLLLPTPADLSELLQQIQQQISLKDEGNAAVHKAQWEKAAEAYSKLLALQPGCAFAAVVHSNRAAAYQHQKRYVEALADCSRAVALDPKYARVYLRMAQILQQLHRADRAVVVLQDALKGSANNVDPATTRGHELTHGATVLRLSTDERARFEELLGTVQAAARKFKTPHHYKALGVTTTASDGDVRKAYRALALKHHPDKALQHCRWGVKPGRTGVAVAHVTAPSGGIEASLKAAANEVFAYLSAAHEELTNSTSRNKLDRDLRTEEQLYGDSNSSSGRAYSSTYGGSSFSSRPTSYTSQGGYGAAGAGFSTNGFGQGGSRPAGGGGNARPWWQQPSGAQAGANRAGGTGQGRPGASKWYQDGFWAGPDDDDASDEDEGADYGSGYHYRSRY